MIFWKASDRVVSHYHYHTHGDVNLSASADEISFPRNVYTVAANIRSADAIAVTSNAFSHRRYLYVFICMTVGSNRASIVANIMHVHPSEVSHV